MQQQNILNVVRNVLPEVFSNDGIQRFDATEIMVEPSFFSEMLGIQGRMDFLHLDHRLLIEQKSGKAEYPITDPPKQKEQHYVQLILYMMLLRYNYREQYERNGRFVHTMLLYSKYPARDGLLDVANNEALFREAIHLRNLIVAQEINIARKGFSSVLPPTGEAPAQRVMRENDPFFPSSGT